MANKFKIAAIWLAVAILIPLSLGGQSKRQPEHRGVPVSFAPKIAQSGIIALQWQSPGQNSGNALPVYQTLDLALGVQSTEPLTSDNFTVLLDESPYAPTGGKSGEVPLVRTPDKGSTHFEFRVKVELPPEGRLHSVRVRVRAGAQTRTSEPLLLERAERPQARVIWQTPDPFAARPVVCDQAVGEVKAVIDALGNALRPGDVTLWLNNRPLRGGELLDTGRGLYRFRQSVTLDNTPEVQTLTLRVFDSVESELMSVVYRPLRRPNLYVLSIGPQTDLKYAAQDARDIAKLFDRQKFEKGLYENVDIQSLVGEAAKTQAIRDAVEGLKTRMLTREIRPNDIVLLFFSSHGLIDKNDFRLEADDFNPGRLRSTSISLKTDVLEILQDMPCKILIFLDACHGPLPAGSKAAPDELARAIRALGDEKHGIAILSSSQTEEYSYEDPAWQNGAFTEALQRGLLSAKADGKGEAGKKDGIITLSELGDFVQNEVKEMVWLSKNKRQTPQLQNPFGDMPIYIVTLP